MFFIGDGVTNKNVYLRVTNHRFQPRIGFYFFFLGLWKYSNSGQWDKCQEANEATFEKKLWFFTKYVPIKISPIGHNLQADEITDVENKSQFLCIVSYEENKKIKQEIRALSDLRQMKRLYGSQYITVEDIFQSLVLY